MLPAVAANGWRGGWPARTGCLGGFAHSATNGDPLRISPGDVLLAAK